MSKEMERVEFTQEMKKDYTILVPNMLPVHFGFLLKVFEEYGYRLKILENDGQAVVDAGLKYVHNDTCYPALLVIGQFMDALHSGEYDLHKTALLITQTGGGCRASNYIHLLRKALKKAGLDYIPVISLNLSGLEKNSGFKLTLPLLRKALAVLAYWLLLYLFAPWSLLLLFLTGAWLPSLAALQILYPALDQAYGLTQRDADIEQEKR